MAQSGLVPIWFYVVAMLLALWNAIGCYFCFQQFRLGAEAMGPATEYDRTLYGRLPWWYNYCYALAVGAGTLGALALLINSSLAHPLFVISLVALVLQFGYLFATTDIIRQKGVGKVVPFPLVIAAIGVFAIWFTAYAQARLWVM
ncbi:MAG: hypothetical protein V4564_08445 [Pseudomonadota bacterium]|uniref:hypothetical protein n=1 Tax=Sphingomonas sp. ERG5 TaxID=1381597 RepID=UPI000A6F696A|nr:hypothetical protein [Sphingomonas sp. ERG5]